MMDIYLRGKVSGVKAFLLSLIIFSFFSLAEAVEYQYRFEWMTPELPQPWYFNDPTDIATTSDGFFYIVDRLNHRIQQFTEQGEFIRSWGAYGNQPGQFSYPEGLAVGSDGSVYVADSGNDKIQVFTGQGEFVRSWGTADSPQDIAVANNGELYVATGPLNLFSPQQINAKIQKFTAQGEFILSWGSGGTEQGQFKVPSGIVVAEDNSVYVADSYNHRIQHFTSQGSFIRSWGSYGDEPGQFRFPKKITITANGDVYVADSSTHRIQQFTLDGSFVSSWGERGSDAGLFEYPHALAITKNGGILVAESGNDRIQQFNENRELVLVWDSKGSDNGEFNKPDGLLVADDGSVYVADTENHRIQHFSAQGQFLESWTEWGGINFSKPYEIALAANGDFYILEHSRVKQFNSQRQFIRSWTGAGVEGGFNWTTGMALGSDGSVYVADSDGNDINRIQQFSAEGDFLRSWGTRGRGDGEFNAHVDIAVDSKGLVYAVDRSNRIQVFSSRGEFIQSWANADLKSAVGIKIDGNDQIFVANGVSFGYQRINQFDRDGNLIQFWGTPGSGPGQFSSLKNLALGADGSIYASDEANHRIQKFIAVEKDIEPDIFNFSPQKDVERNIEVFSNAVTISGIDSTVAINVSNGQYQINGGVWRMSGSTLSVGDSVSVKHTSSEDFGADVSTTLTVGGVSGSFISTTIAFSEDMDVDGFSFALQKDVERNQEIISDAVTVSGINVAVTVSVNNGEFQINNGVWRADATTVNNGDTVRVRHLSATNYNTQVTTTLSINGLTREFSSITKLQTAVDEPGGRGIIEGRVLNGCNKKPFPLLKVNFNDLSNNSFFQQTDRDGRYVVGLDSGEYVVSTSNEDFQDDSQTVELMANETRIANFHLLPENGCRGIQPAKTRQALIIAGSGPQLPGRVNNIWESTLALADRAYVALVLQGYQNEDIRYLTADGEGRDADGDGENDVDGLATLESVEEMLTQWAGGVEQLVVYFVGHGGVESFQLERNRVLTPTQLNSWLNIAQGKMSSDQRGQPGKLTVVMDACKSGSFIPKLAAANRYVVTSTAADRDAVIGNEDGSRSFSYHFWGQIGLKDGWLSTAFQQARQSMSGEFVGWGKKQKAMLDADGSGGETSPDDYAAVDNYCYGDCLPHASVGIVIESVSPLEALNGNITAKLKVRASKVVEKAWVTIQRPDYHFPTDGTAVSSVLQLDLSCDDKTCEGEYNNFNINDFYPVSFYVQDRDKNVSLPFTLDLYQSDVSNNAEKKNTPTVFEEQSGVLTLKDVAVGDQHFYVEMFYLGDGKFSIQNYYPMSDAASDAPAVFDGIRVKVPKLYALGKFYRFELIFGEGFQFLIDWESFEEL